MLALRHRETAPILIAIPSLQRYAQCSKPARGALHLIYRIVRRIRLLKLFHEFDILRRRMTMKQARPMPSKLNEPDTGSAFIASSCPY